MRTINETGAPPLTPNLPQPWKPGSFDQFTQSGSLDVWKNPYPYKELVPGTGLLAKYHDPDASTPIVAARVNEDVLLNNVLSMDVRAWDPRAPVIEYRDTNGDGNASNDIVAILQPGDVGYNVGLNLIVLRVLQSLKPSLPDTAANRLLVTSLALGNAATTGNIVYTVVGHGAYVDLGYAAVVTGYPNGLAPNVSSFSGVGNHVVPRLYDTWSTHYEEQTGGTGVDGFDNPILPNFPDGDSLIDDPSEWLYGPPYWAPLRGVQIRLRVFEPDSKQIREVTFVVQFVAE